MHINFPAPIKDHNSHVHVRKVDELIAKTSQHTLHSTEHDFNDIITGRIVIQMLNVDINHRSFDIIHQGTARKAIIQRKSLE